MPFNKLKLAAMTAEREEYIDKDVIANRLGVDKRTVERLIEQYAKMLKKSKRRQGRKVMYLWANVLQCAKLHTGIEKKCSLCCNQTGIHKATHQGIGGRGRAAQARE